MSDVLYSFNSKSFFSYILITIIGVFFAHYCIMTWQGEVFELHRNIVAVVGFFANFRIIYYHLTVPPHPKFLLMRKRKIMVRTHAAFGMLEVMTGLVAIFYPLKEIGLFLGGLAFLHALTSLAQAPSVFGAKAIMIPCYFMAGTLHAYMGVRLMMEPTSPFWIMNTFLTVNIYAYVRVFMMAFDRVGIFKDNHYSLAVIGAGFVVFPALMGPAAPFYMIAQIFIYLIIAKVLFGLSNKEMKVLWHEKAREQLVNQQVKNEWLLTHMGDSPKLSSRLNKETARKVFDKLDQNGNGFLEPNEMKAFLNAWGTSNEAVAAMDNHLDKPIDFERFFKIVQSTGIMSDAFKEMQRSEAHTDEDKARLVFNELDFDQSGYIERIELEMLLLEYGLPRLEAKAYLDKYDTNGDKKISFEEFFQHFAPLWRFAYALALT